MGKRIRPSFKSHKSFNMLPENYKVVRDVHQPIVDPEEQEKTLEKDLRAKKARLSEVDNLFQFLYEDKLNGKISERNYQMMSRRYEEEQASLEQAIGEMEKQHEESGREKNNIEQFTRIIKDYAGIEELSAALLNTLIEKVTVGEPKEVDGERIQEVKIYYKFIGNIS